MLSKRGWWLVALALGLGLGASALRRASKSAAVGGGGAERARARDVVPAVGADTFRVPVAPGDPAWDAIPAAPSPTAGVGEIRGLVLGAKGEPLVGHQVSFKPLDEGRTDGFSARADDAGVYTKRAVAAGRYRAAYLGDPGDPNRCLVRSGEVEVRAGSITQFDFLLEGDRVLEGRILFEDDPEMAVELRLRRAWAADALVGEGWAEPDHDPSVEGAGAEVAEDPEQRARDPHERCGRFRFAGLAPDVYLLRVIGGRSTQSGQELAIEREVDLLGGDVELPTWTFDFPSFVEESRGGPARAGTGK